MSLGHGQKQWRQTSVASESGMKTPTQIFPPCGIQRIGRRRTQQWRTVWIARHWNEFQGPSPQARLPQTTDGTPRPVFQNPSTKQRRTHWRRKFALSRMSSIAFAVSFVLGGTQELPLISDSLSLQRAGQGQNPLPACFQPSPALPPSAVARQGKGLETHSNLELVHGCSSGWCRRRWNNKSAGKTFLEMMSSGWMMSVMPALMTAAGNIVDSCLHIGRGQSPRWNNPSQYLFSAPPRSTV